MSAIRPYRPSNGTEGDWFMATWCEHCSKDSPGHPCRILGRTMALAIDDPGYPKEWVTYENGPGCTAFTDKPRPPRPNTIRDKRQEALPL